MDPPAASLPRAPRSHCSSVKPYLSVEGFACSRSVAAGHLRGCCMRSGRNTNHTCPSMPVLMLITSRILVGNCKKQWFHVICKEPISQDICIILTERSFGDIGRALTRSSTTLTSSTLAGLGCVAIGLSRFSLHLRAGSEETVLVAFSPRHAVPLLCDHTVLLICALN